MNFCKAVFALWPVGQSTDVSAVLSQRCVAEKRQQSPLTKMSAGAGHALKQYRPCTPQLHSPSGKSLGFCLRFTTLWQVGEENCSPVVLPRLCDLIKSRHSFSVWQETALKIKGNLSFWLKVPEKDKKNWYTRRDSNSWPSTPEADALSSWATGASSLNILHFWGFQRPETEKINFFFLLLYFCAENSFFFFFFSEFFLTLGLFLL